MLCVLTTSKESSTTGCINWQEHMAHGGRIRPLSSLQLEVIIELLFTRQSSHRYYLAARRHRHSAQRSGLALRLRRSHPWQPAHSRRHPEPAQCNAAPMSILVLETLKRGIRSGEHAENMDRSGVLCGKRVPSVVLAYAKCSGL